jgi:hypothetical protein
MSTQTSGKVQSDYRRLLASVFDFMRKSGFQENEVKQICAEALAQTKRGDSRTGESASTLAAAALALDTWHRNRRYMVGAAPRAIPLLGPPPSVEALIRSQGIPVESRALIRHLRSLGLITRTTGNRYRPSGRMAIGNRLDTVMQQHAARSYSRLLATIRHNTRRAGRSSGLIERFAEVPDLPRTRVTEFRRFARTQGGAFLRTLNDWLESRRPRTATARTRRTVRAGVHLYAYVDSTGLNTTKRKQQSP